VSEPLIEMFPAAATLTDRISAVANIKFFIASLHFS